jgi:hypothetical protein
MAMTDNRLLSIALFERISHFVGGALLLVGCSGACSHPFKDKTVSDAAAASPHDVAEVAETGTAADIAAVPGLPDAVEALFERPQGDPSPLPDARDLFSDLVEAAVLSQDASRPDATDAAASEASLWADAHWLIDGACSDNPRDLMQILAASLSTHEIMCSRTESNLIGIDPEGYIAFDAEGRVRYITGRRIPADPVGWVESLAAYRWPCLASQTIAYGCSL